MPHNRDSIAPPGSGSTSVFRGQTSAYVIESSSKLLIDSIYGLFLKYGDADTQADRLDFTMTLAELDGNSNGNSDSNSNGDSNGDDIRHAIHVSGSLNREKTRRSIVTCTTLGDYMADQTVGMPNDRLARMLELLHEQMRDLQGGVPSYGVPYYGLNDILIINDAFFCFFNDDKLFVLDPNTRRMDVTRPISRDHAFYAPELKGRLHALPYEVDYSASLYSLGLLTAFCALLKWDLVSTDAKKGAWRTHSDSELVKMLDPIKYSKLYWFVLRCCRTDATRRLCVFV